MNPLDAVARYGSQSNAADALGVGRTKFRMDYKLALFQQSGANCHPTGGTFPTREQIKTPPDATLSEVPK